MMPPTIGIIGDGFGAAALVIHLSQHAPEYLDKLIIFGTGTLGSGAAYACATPDYKLNVRSDVMRIWPDNPGHFTAWAEQHLDDGDAHYSAGDFYQRKDFARYLTTCLADVAQTQKITQILERVISARALSDSQDTRWEVETEHGALYKCDHLILATGNPQPIWPCSVGLRDDDNRLIQSVWRGDWQTSVSARDDVNIIGGGLTAMDVIYALFQAGHKGQIKVITPNGMLPPVQTPWTVKPAFKWPICRTARDVVQAARSVLGQDWTQISWQESFETLRIGLNDVYQGLSGIERRRLMRHFGGWWMLARFRCSPPTHEAACALQESGQLQVVSGRALSLDEHKTNIQLTLLDGAALISDKVINCTGPAGDALLSSMIDRGLLHPSPVGSGMAVSASLECHRLDMSPWKSLSAIGSMTGGSLGDIVATSSIARQALLIAQRLA